MQDATNKFKLAVFDLDGVLVDACEWHRMALNFALLEICNYEISLDEHHSFFNGMPTRTKLQLLNDRGVVNPEQNAQIEVLKQQKTIEIINTNAGVRPEKIELLEYLRAKNMYVTCYTNSIRSTAELMLQKTGIKQLFHAILTNQDVRHPKPSPEGYVTCMKMFNVPPNECVIIEDSPKGIQAARLSGATVVEVENPDQVSLNYLRDRIS